MACFHFRHKETKENLSRSKGHQKLLLTLYSKTVFKLELFFFFPRTRYRQAVILRATTPLQQFKKLKIAHFEQSIPNGKKKKSNSFESS